MRLKHWRPKQRLKSFEFLLQNHVHEFIALGFHCLKGDGTILSPKPGQCSAGAGLNFQPIIMSALTKYSLLFAGHNSNSSLGPIYKEFGF